MCALALNGSIAVEPFQVVFSPNGARLLSTTLSGVYAQTVSKGGVVSDPVSYLGSSFCKYPKGFALGALGSGIIDSVAYGRNGALLAEVEDPVVRPIKGEPKSGVLHIYRVSGSKLLKGSCRSLPGYGYHVAFGPAGLLAVTNAGKNTVTVYSVSAAGKMHQTSVFATGNHPDADTFGPTLSGGHALAVANAGDSTISTFTVSSGFVARGRLAVRNRRRAVVSRVQSDRAAGSRRLGCQPDRRLLGELRRRTQRGRGRARRRPADGCIEHHRQAARSADYSDASLFAVATGGLLAPVSGSPFSPTGGPNSIAVDHHHFLLTVGTSRGTAVYSYAPS